MPLPFRALRDPLADQLDFAGGQLAARIGGRHVFRFVRGNDSPIEFAFPRLSRYKDLHSVAVGEDLLLAVQTQVGLPLAFVRAVAEKAVVRKNRPNVPIELHLIRSPAETR